MHTQQSFLSSRFLSLALALAVTSMLALGGAGAAFADDHHDDHNYRERNDNRGGYVGPGPDLITVQQALQSADDTRVALKGRITKSLGDKHYTFTDDTGSMQVEIGRKAWRGQQVGPDDIVVVHGKIDKGFSKTELDVKNVMKQ